MVAFGSETLSGLLHLHQGRMDRFTAADGLSGDVVTGRIFEDREGNIWVGTLGGIDRFRAYAIPTMGTNEGLSSADSGTVEAGPDGGVWIATAGGLDRWQNERMTAYGGQGTRGEGETERASGGAPTRITQSGFTGVPHSLELDTQGRLWVSSDEGLFISEGGQFVHVPSVPGGHINSIVEGTDGHMWISQIEHGLLGVAPGKPVERIPWARFGEKRLGARALLADPGHGGLWLGFY